MQEQAAEQAAEARKAAEAEQMRRRAAVGAYGGGSGPLRDGQGRPITDLNQARAAVTPLPGTRGPTRLAPVSSAAKEGKPKRSAAASMQDAGG